MPSVLTESVILELNAQEPWPQNVKLYQPNEVNQILLPDSSNCLAVQTYLKMCGLSFEVEPRKNAEYMSPSGKVPFIKCGAFVIAELEPIIGFINSKGITLTQDLDSAETADMHAYISLVNNVLANAELYICWCDPTTLNEVTKPRNGSVYPWPLNHFLNYTKRNQIVKRLGVLGWTQKNLDEVYKEIENCCTALSQRLGPKDYFFGSKPTELDALVFGHMQSILHSWARIPKLADLVNKFPKLIEHKNMIYSKFGPPPEWCPRVPKLPSREKKSSETKFARGDLAEMKTQVFTIFSPTNIKERNINEEDKEYINEKHISLKLNDPYLETMDDLIEPSEEINLPHNSEKNENFIDLSVNSIQLNDVNRTENCTELADNFENKINSIFKLELESDHRILREDKTSIEDEIKSVRIDLEQKFLQPCNKKCAEENNTIKEPNHSICEVKEVKEIKLEENKEERKNNFGKNVKKEIKQKGTLQSKKENSNNVKEMRVLFKGSNFHNPSPLLSREKNSKSGKLLALKKNPAKLILKNSHTTNKKRNDLINSKTNIGSFDKKISNSRLLIEKRRCVISITKISKNENKINKKRSKMVLNARAKEGKKKIEKTQMKELKIPEIKQIEKSENLEESKN